MALIWKEKYSFKNTGIVIIAEYFPNPEMSESRFDHLITICHKVPNLIGILHWDV